MSYQACSARWSVAVVAAVACLAVEVAPVSAQEDDQEKQEFDDPVHVVQRKPVLKKQRFEFAPRFGTSLNDAIYRSFKVGANANYHITERLHIGGLFEWYDFGGALGGRTGAYEKSYDQTSTEADAPVLNWFGGLEGGFVPIYGKFTLFNSAILHYDIGASLGAGYANVESVNSTSDDGTFGATGSLMARLFLNDWMALDFELRDIFFPATLTTGGQQHDVLANVVTFSGGVSLYLPTSFEYSEAQGD